jgi:hypothetical protein
MSLDLRAIARTLGGEVVGNQVLCPGPGHSPQDRSLSVLLSHTGGIISFSHAGDDWRLCSDHVRRLLGMPLVRKPGEVPAEPVQRQKPKRTDNDKAERIGRLWAAAGDPKDTVVEAYLASRALILPEEIAGSVIRFNPRCAWRDHADGEVLSVPAMIAAMRCIHTDRLIAVQRTQLARDGIKIGRRMSGMAAGAAIKLDADENVTHGLVIGEGFETCLAARQIGFAPVWALGSAQAIARLPVLAGIEALTILAQSDETTAQWRNAGRAGTAPAARWRSFARKSAPTSTTLFARGPHELSSQHRPRVRIRQRRSVRASPGHSRPRGDRRGRRTRSRCCHARRRGAGVRAAAGGPARL